jgi:uroporphyrinogen decarboxylase
MGSKVDGRAQAAGGELTPRQRVSAALEHREPDKVPLDLGGTLATILTREANARLRDFLGLPEERPLVAEMMCNTVRPSEDLLERYQSDVRPIYLSDPTTGKMDFESLDRFRDAYGVLWRKASYYYDAVERPLREGTLEELADAPWETIEPQAIAGLGEEARRLYGTTGYCLIADIPCIGPFEGGCTLRGYDDFLVDLHQNSTYAEALLEKITETALQKWSLLLDEVGEYIQVAAQGDDLGMQLGTYISPEMYRRFIKPRHRRIFDLIHSKSRAKIFLHTCGSVYAILPDLLDIGLEVLNPVQKSAANMGLKRLKSEFGADLCFWGGGIDIQRLPFLDSGAIEQEIRETLDTMAPGGGYVFAFTHNLQPDVPPEKVDQLLRAFLRMR